ncbi:MAG: hypothetical protein JNM89_13095 [Hyphomicrobiaceae bacterium]|nr:hypothetical protein [Hyphomicrobiaceae bacterium]
MRLHDAADCCSSEATGMAGAVLNEIAELLEHFAKTGEETIVDLRGLPMTDADRAALEDALGQGEVTAVVDVAGPSEVWETSYAGVWWVRHRGADERITSEEIVVTRVPAILLSHSDDVRASASRLRETLASDDVTEPAQTIDQGLEETSHVG